MCPTAAGRQSRPHDLLPPADPVIAARGLTKTYGAKTAVDGITSPSNPAA